MQEFMALFLANGPARLLLMLEANPPAKPPPDGADEDAFREASLAA